MWTFKLISQCFVFFLQLFNLHFKRCYLLVPIIRDKLEVLNSIVGFNVVFMMDYLPTMEVATEMFRHYKAMLKDIVVGFIGHGVKEIIGLEKYQVIAVRHTSSTLPALMLFGKGMEHLSTVARLASQANRVSLINCNPFSPPTIRTSKPLKFSSTCLIPYFPTLLELSQYRHMNIIQDQLALVKEANRCVA